MKREKGQASRTALKAGAQTSKEGSLCESSFMTTDADPTKAERETQCILGMALEEDEQVKWD